MKRRDVDPTIRRRLLQVSVATFLLGLYFTVGGRWLLAYSSFGIGLLAACGAALLLRR